MIFPLENNAQLEKTLENIVKSGRVPHAFLIESEDNAQALELAWYIAALCVCTGQGRPCGQCRECRLTAGKNHPDIALVEPESGKKMITVAAVRELRGNAYVKPHSAESKVFIISGAERMNAQAQNALLKVLEEPPTGVHFVLTAGSRAKLLPTVNSRCVLLSVNQSATENDSKAAAAAKEFVQKMFACTEAELLRLLYPFEKNRVSADEFFDCLEREITAEAKKSVGNTSRLRRLNALFSDIAEYKKQLTLNVNLSLLFSAMVCRLVG